MIVGRVITPCRIIFVFVFIFICFIFRLINLVQMDAKVIVMRKCIDYLGWLQGL